MSNNDIVSYCAPNFGNCGAAFNDLIPSAVEPHVCLLDQHPIVSDIWVKCLGSFFIPCCSCAVQARNMERFSGSSYESECLKVCFLSYFGCYCCYYPKKRGEFRAKYGLRGSPLMDCAGACCFMPCMICQDAVELMHVDSDYAVPYCSLDAAAKASADVKNVINKKEEEKPAADQPVALSKPFTKRADLLWLLDLREIA